MTCFAQAELAGLDLVAKGFRLGVKDANSMPWGLRKLFEGFINSLKRNLLCHI